MKFIYYFIFIISLFLFIPFLSFADPIPSVNFSLSQYGLFTQTDLISGNQCYWTLSYSNLSGSGSVSWRSDNLGWTCAGAQDLTNVSIDICPTDGTPCHLTVGIFPDSTTYSYPAIYKSSAGFLLFSYASIPSICADQTTETDCVFYPSCSWSGSVCSYNLATALTLPTQVCSSPYDIPCQLKNYAIWFITDSPAQINTVLSSMLNSVIHLWPLGYVTRLVTIFSNTTAIEPPAISYTMGTASASTGLTGTYTFQVFDHLDTINSVTEDTNGGTRNIWDIFMPFWNTLVYLSLFITIITTLLHSHLGHTLEASIKHKSPKKTK